MTARVLAAVWVPGVPRTQGSMEHIGKGRMKHSDALVRWRSLVASAVGMDCGMRGQGRYAGPVAVRCIFVRDDGQGDIDKLARAVLDALTDSGVIGDDVQVVELRCSRVRAAHRGDGAFVLVATVDDPMGTAYMDQVDAVAAEIDGWVGR